MGACSGGRLNLISGIFDFMQRFSQILEKKLDRSDPYVMQWMAALAQGEALVEGGVISDVIFEQVLTAVESDHALAAWVALVGVHAKEYPQEVSGEIQFMACVEKSPYCLSMWLESLGYFYDWMCARKGGVTLEEALAYLQECEVQALQKMPVKTLYFSLVEALDLYGVEDL